METFLIDQNLIKLKFLPVAHSFLVLPQFLIDPYQMLVIKVDAATLLNI